MVLFLETCTAEVSSGRACPEEGKPSPVEEAARKDSAVHVSLSSDSLVKQPGDHGGPPSRCAGKPPKPKPSDRNRTTGHLISEELRRRAIAPESGAARRCGGFIWAGRRACQHQMPQISPQLRAVEQRCLSYGPRASPGGPRRTGATFLPRCSHRGKASGHGTNHRTLGSLTRLRWRGIVRLRAVDLSLGERVGPPRFVRR